MIPSPLASSSLLTRAVTVKKRTRLPCMHTARPNGVGAAVLNHHRNELRGWSTLTRLRTQAAIETCAV